jgi:hypothetical protein
LHGFDGRVLIREMDREVSFIDSVSVLEECSDGATHFLFPLNKSLQHNDDDYLVHKQGDEFFVELGLPKTRLCYGRYSLLTKGFYLPQ